jgi:nucleotide-binding universal stress UspA family protein
MCIAKIIVPLLGTKRDREALAAAFAAAKPFHAHVVALLVRPDPRFALPFMGAPISGEVIQELVEAAEKTNHETAKAARVTLAEAAAAANAVVEVAPRMSETASCSFLEMEGYFPSCVTEASRFSDLVVFGPMTTADGPDLGDAFAETLTRTERPVLLASHAPKDFPGKVFVAWDGSATAARAVVGAVPLLRKAREVVLLSCHRLQKTQSKNVIDYLALHGVSCREETVDTSHRSVGEALLDGATKGGAGLLVMGGFGHSQMGEVIFGGVTQHVRWHATIPVLMIH